MPLFTVTDFLSNDFSEVLHYCNMRNFPNNTSNKAKKEEIINKINEHITKFFLLDEEMDFLVCEINEHSIEIDTVYKVLDKIMVEVDKDIKEIPIDILSFTDLDLKMSIKGNVIEPAVLQECNIQEPEKVEREPLISKAQLKILQDISYKIVLYINKKINDSLVCSNVLEDLVNNKAFDAGVVNMLISNKLKAYHEKLHGIVMKIVVLGYPQLGIPKNEPIFDFEDESFDNVMTWEEITEDFTDEFTKEYDDWLNGDQLAVDSFFKALRNNETTIEEDI